MKYLLGICILCFFSPIFAMDDVKGQTYPNSEAFLQAEWKTCKLATDGCNTIQISNGKLGASTAMYCEDVYGKDGQEAWSCLDEKWDNTKEKTYPDSKAFLKAEWSTCKVATDGCNTVHIDNGKLWIMTQMYCEEIYGENGQEVWSCLDTQIQEETIGFLSESDQNHYMTIKDTLGAKNTMRIQKLISNFGEKVLKKAKYDTPKATRALDATVKKIEAMLQDLVSQYPADMKMSQRDTFKYQVLTLAKYELQIMKHRWIRNTTQTLDTK